MFCSNCGHKNADEALFCSECGTKLVAVPQQEEKEPEVEQPAVLDEEIEEEATVLLEEESVKLPEIIPEPEPVVEEEPVAEPEPVSEPEPVAEPEPVVAQPKVMPIVQPIVQPVAQPVQPSPVSTPVNKGSCVVEALKKVARSPLMIIASILYTITSLISIITSVSDLGEAHDLTALGLPAAFEHVFTIFFVISVIVTLLVVFGLWITVIQGFRKDAFSTVGLTMLKGVSIAQFVVVCIAIFFVLISLFTILDEIDSDMMPMVLVVVGILALIFTYYLLIVTSISNAKKMAKGVVKKASAYVGVMLYISSVILLITLIISLVIAGSFDYAMEDLARQLDLGDIEITSVSLDPLSVITSLISIVNTFIFGLVIFNQRGKVKELGYANK